MCFLRGIPAASDPVNLADVPMDVLREMLDQARDSGDTALLQFYVDALEAHAHELSDRYFPDARPKQIPPVGDWSIWMILTGRGFGKTRTGAEWIVEQALTNPGTTWAVAAPTFGDARAICIEGRGEEFKPSGVLSVLHRRGLEPEAWNKSLGELRFPNGSLLKLLSGEQPERTRGYNFSGGWVDELATFPYEDTWDFLQFALRVGENPRLCVTTTPRPVNLVRRLVEREGNGVVITRGTIYENKANLSARAVSELEAQYAGTRLGAQELLGEIIDLGGELIDPSWFRIVKDPSDYPRKVRSWDLAGSLPSAMNEDPDWSVGALVSYQPEQQPYMVADGTVIHAGAFCIEDVIRMRDSPAQVEQAVLSAARRDGPGVKVVIEREPGQSGLSQIDHFRQVLQGVALVEEFRPTGPKEVRAQLIATAAQQGRIEVVSAEWREAMYDEMRAFPYGKHDDITDSISAALAVLEGRGGIASAQAPQGQLPGRQAVLNARVR